jgi:hypothetical protein
MGVHDAHGPRGCSYRLCAHSPPALRGRWRGRRALCRAVVPRTVTSLARRASVETGPCRAAANPEACRRRGAATAECWSRALRPGRRAARGLLPACLLGAAARQGGAAEAVSGPHLGTVGLGCSGELQPGEQMPTLRQISEEYRVAQTTARKVIDALAREGLVEIKPRWGTFVR